MKRFWRWFKNLFRKEKRPVVVTKPVAYNGDILKVQLHSTTGFTNKEIEKLNSAIGLLVRVVNSFEFKLAVLNTPLERTNGLTNREVYNKIMSGQDKYGESDNDLDIKITMYYSSKRVIGYTYKGGLRSFINRRYFRIYGLDKIVENLIHEAMHNIGFTHKKRKYSLDSVPYAVGRIAGNLTRRIIGGQSLTAFEGDS